MANETRDLLVKINGDASGFEKSMNQAKSASDSGAMSFAKMAGAVAAGQAIFAAGSAALHKLGSEAMSTVNDAEALVKSTIKIQRETGLTAEAASGLLAVFNRFGIEVDGASKSFGLFAKQVTAAANGNQTAIDNFKHFNVTVKDAKGHVKDFTTIFGEVADQFQKAPAGMDKTAESMKLFGKSGKDLLPILNLGSAGIRQLEEDANKYGLVLTQNNVDSVRKYIIAQKDMNEAMEGVRIKIGLAVLPAMTMMAQKFAAFVSSDKFRAWIKEVTDWLSANLPKALKWINEQGIPFMVNAWKTIEPVLKTTLNIIKDVTKYLNEHHGVLKGVIITLGLLLVAFKLAGALQAFSGVIGGMTAVWHGFTALLASPIILPALAVAAVLASIALVYKSWQDTKAVIEQTTAHIKGDINSAKSAVDSLNNSLNGTPAQAARAQNALLKLGTSQSAINNTLLGAGHATFASGGFTGTGGANDIAGIVHKGEYVVPKNNVDQATGQPKSMGGAGVTLNVNVGMYAGMPVEKREIAMSLWRELVRSARAQGVQLPNIGSVVVQ